MKRLTLTLALILISLMSFSQTKDSEGHTLVSLWKTYYKAENADKPQDQLAALDAIKQEAISRHLAWDFYDAAQKYVSVRSSINWKVRTEATNAMYEEINKFGEPVAVYFLNRSSWGKDKCIEYVESQKDVLQKSYNPEFHSKDGNISGFGYTAALLKFISNDYEYALWSIFGAHRDGNIRDYYEDKYPEEALIEFTDCGRYLDDSSYAKYGEYINEYGDKAVTMLAREKRLEYEFRQLRNDESSTSDDFKALRDRCRTFESDKSKYTGDEKLIATCTSAKSIIESLESKEINLSINDGVVEVIVRNLKSVDLILTLGGRQALKKTLENKANRFYLRDAISYKLPDLDDGEYQVVCQNGNESVKCRYVKNTLSIATRATNEGYGAFVAEYDTGRPLKVCDFQLLNSDGGLITTVSNVKLDGFTTLPAQLQKYFNKDDYHSYQLRACDVTPGGRKRISSPIRTRSPHPGMVDPIVNEMNGHMLILTDRGAYNPGETLHFKAILYRGTYEYELAGAGETVEVELYDPEDHLLGSKSLKTSDFGSVEGSFPLVGGSKGGLFSIRASSNSARGSKDVRVDEFVLPTFDVTWEKDDNLYLLGDEVRVAGRVTAYSGHALGSVKARCRIEGQGERDVEIAPDGRFSFKFRTGESARYYGYPITLTIVDNTGETLEFNTHKMVFINLPFSISLRNPVAGRYGLTSDASRYNPSGSWIIRDPYARFEFSNAGYKRDGVIINWEIKNEKDETVSSGKASPDEPLDIDISKLPSGLYKIYGISHARYADGKDASCDRALSFVKAADDDTALNMDAIYFFKELGGEDIAVQFGTTDGPVWAAVELVGSGNVLLEHQIVHLTGERGKAGSLKTISYARKDSYPETLTLYILFFHKGKSYSYTRTINLPVIVPRLPLEFTRFTDLAKPGQEVSLLIKTNPGIECAATIFDKATETIKSNEWYRVEPYRKPEPRVSYYDECGYNGSRYDIYATEAGGRMYRKGVGAAAVETAVMMEDNMVMEEAEDTRASRDAAPQEEVHVREDFDATMHWEPALHSDKDGLMELKFTGCDRLSTYYVQLFAHGEGMINETLRREMKVSIPVKVSIVQPLFLYEGDDYTARVSLSSSMEVPVSGKVSVRFYNGNSYKDSPVIATKSARVTIPAGGSIPFEAPVSMPQGVAELGVRVDFVADNSAYGSDAVFTVIPGMRAVQTLTEAHSAVLLAGADRDAVIAGLRSMFVNADASALEPVERDILGMIKDAIPDSVEPKGTDVINLTEAYYANILARRVGANGLGDAELQEIKEKIVACQNTSGGIAWFQGMESSPTVTAAVLQRIAAMPEAEGCGINVDAAVLYLDDSYFERANLPWWCGGISLAKYLQTRAMFASVPFSSRSGKAWREFKKEVKNYLTPSKARGLNGQILDKARRLRTLQLLADSDEGKALAKSWGLRMRKCLLNSLDADVESLLQYAVDHRSGGCYYPNAVMPWRGLMESELYAHALLCDLLTCVGSRSTGAAGKKLSYAPQALKAAEGIRIWIMIQKETQHWEDDAAYIEAIASVLRGTPKTLQTRVVLMSAEFTKPFPEVKAAGNGFTISRQFVRDDETLHDGDPVHVGDRIKAIYRIWNEENRSFVRVSAPRPASLRPVDQLSGHYGWWLHPMSYGGWSFSPQGYRNVLSDKTEYWFDAYPEENTTITEYFFVTQEGRFQMPAVWVESLYAPHYRANDDGRGPLESD